MISRIALCCLSAAFFFACTTRKADPSALYYTLTDGENIADFEGKKVRFPASPAEIPMAHMMRPSLKPPGEERHIYLDPLPIYGFGQIVAYFNDSSIEVYELQPDQVYMFSGTVGSVSGPGMGGGTHTEYFLELEAVEPPPVPK